MALVNLTTDLKSLRYGRDRKGGGSSNQPYITNPLPQGILNTADALGPDFLLRGGILAPSRSVQDVSRLTKMFIDTKSPAGILFTAKQNLLSRIGVETVPKFILNEGAYLPTSTILQAGGNAFGVHLNKQGIDPTGILNPIDPLGLPQYEPYTRGNRNPLNPFSPEKSKIKNLFDTKLDGNDTILLDYSGGPGSILGIGKTSIKRISNTSLGSGNSETYTRYPQFKKYNYITWDYSLIKNQRTTLNVNSTITADFRKFLTPPNSSTSNIPQPIVNYTDKNIEKRVNLGDPGKRANKNYSNYTKGIAYQGGVKALDKINALPIYRSSEVKLDSNAYPVNDLVKFRIAAIDGTSPNFKTFIHFRAFIDSFSDSYTADWTGNKYMGRGEDFYTYNGFGRTISLSFTVAAQSKQELIPMYQKLNYLASLTAPDYTGTGFMRGNLVYLTVGDWLVDVPGVLKGMSLGIPNESPWEIARDETGRK